MISIFNALLLVVASDSTNHNIGCLSDPMYYNYHSADMLTVKDSTIRDLRALKTRFPKDIDSSIFDVSKMVDLDYNQLDALYSFVRNGSSNVIINNTAIGTENTNCLWLVYAYRDGNDHLNAFVKVIGDDSLQVGKHSIFDPDYPKFFLQSNYWKSDWNNETVNFFLVLNLENGCGITKNSRKVSKADEKNNNFIMPTIIFLDEPSIRYPEPFSASSIFAFRQNKAEITRLTNEYCYNSKRIYQLNEKDLEQLRHRINHSENKKTKKALQKEKLFGLAYIDRYGRIDVVLYQSRESSYYQPHNTGRKMLIYNDLYETLPKCKSE